MGKTKALLLAILAVSLLAGCESQSERRWPSLPILVRTHTATDEEVIETINSSLNFQLFESSEEEGIEIDPPDNKKELLDKWATTYTTWDGATMKSAVIKIWPSYSQKSWGANVLAHELMHAIGLHYHIEESCLMKSSSSGDDSTPLEECFDKPVIDWIHEVYPETLYVPIE